MTNQKWRGRHWLTGVVAVVTVLGPIGALAPAGAVENSSGQESGSDRTSALEARRVDSVPTPKLAWKNCGVDAQCASVLLPLDYDQPNGAKTKVALLRRPARDQARRVGSLFLNPGGPSGSGTAMARGALGFLSPALLDRFDVVGVDPRGVNMSDRLECFTSTAQQTNAEKGLMVPFPMGMVETRAYIASAKNVGVACSGTGRPLSASMSTAEVARDMDVLRRAVGDRKLTYLGFSYGSYLGQVYANMFPDRVRSLAIDGVVDPVAWAGTPDTASSPQWERLLSAEGASKALRELLRLCERAGKERCAFAASGDPEDNFDLLAKRLEKKPLTLPNPFGGPPFAITYAGLVALTQSALYSPLGYVVLDLVLPALMTLTDPLAAAGTAATTVDRPRVMRALSIRIKALEAEQKQVGLGLPYENSLDVFYAVPCTDGVSPPDISSRQWAEDVARADKRAKYFGRFRAWQSAGCASSIWTARDEDAYHGPFNRRTASPVLVVGNKWDPATNYEGAVAAASLLPNSRLLSSDSWGHTAYRTSQCATSAIDTYLLTQVLPARGTNCHGDVQPFQDNALSGSLGTTAGAQRTPVVAPIAPRH